MPVSFVHHPLLDNLSDDIATRLAFHGLDEAACETLRRDEEYIMAHVPVVLDEFYAHAVSFDDVRSLFKDAAQVERAKTMQHLHWKRLWAARFDADYINAVVRVGKAHFSLNVPPKWYISGYARLMTQLNNRLNIHFAETFPGRPISEAFALTQAVAQAMMFDLECAISVYVEDANSIFI